MEPRRSSDPTDTNPTSWRASSPAFLPMPAVPVLPSMPLQPWSIRGRPSSARGGSAEEDVPTQARQPSEKTCLEWNVLKAGMTARARQKDDYARQGNSADSYATRAPAKILVR